MTLPEPTPYVSAWNRLVGKPPAAHSDEDPPAAPKKTGYRGPSAAGICVAAAILLVGHTLGINPFGPILGVVARDLGITATTTQQGTSGYHSVTTQEALYLQRLTNTGVPYSDPASTITVGRNIGQLYDQGYSPEQITYALYGEFAKYGNPYTPAQVQAITYAGIVHFGTRQWR